jgi:YD repeat-containing protein
LSYDDLGRLQTQTAVRAAGGSCAESGWGAVRTLSYTYDEEQGLANRSRGQLTAVSSSDGSFGKQLRYNARGQLARATVWVYGAPAAFTATYEYDAYDRLAATVYPDGEVVRITGYTSQGQPLGLAVSGAAGPNQPLVESARYDAAGRLVAVHYGGDGGQAGTGVWVTHAYWPWQEVGGGGRYAGMTVGRALGGYELAPPGTATTALAMWRASRCGRAAGCSTIVSASATTTRRG